VSNAVGLVGVFLILIGYAGVQLGKLDPRALIALLLNFIGAALVLVSLAFDFNLSAVIMEGIWVALALYGLVRLALKKRP
jgi:hypothetical protein